MKLFCLLFQAKKGSSNFFLCGPTAHFYTSMIVLDSIFKIGMDGPDSLIEREFCQREHLVSSALRVLKRIS